MRVYDIFMQKVEEIQRRLPLRMGVSNKLTFKNLLQKKIDARNNSIKEIKPDMSALSANSGAPVEGKTTEFIESCISDASGKYGIDRELIRAVIKYESGYNPMAVSSAGAEGLMQLMPETAVLLGVKDSFDIRQNIDGGTHFLRNMLDAFDGNLELALAAYNAGPVTVREYGGVPPYEETEKYIENVLRDYNMK